MKITIVGKNEQGYIGLGWRGGLGVLGQDIVGKAANGEVEIQNGAVENGKLRVTVGAERHYENPNRFTVIGKNEEGYYVVHTHMNGESTTRIVTDGIVGALVFSHGCVPTNASVRETGSGYMVKPKKGEFPTIKDSVAKRLIGRM